MRTLRLQAFLTSALLLVGCGGDLTAPGGIVPPGGNNNVPEIPQGVDALQLFETNVRPILAANCAACHAGNSAAVGAPNFLGSGSTSEYHANLKLRGYIVAPESSLLVTKGAHPPGTAFSPTDKPKVEEWLRREVAGTTNPNPTPTPGAGRTLDEAFARFGKCMTRANWDNLGMPNVANQEANGNGANNDACYACHYSGAGGAYLADPNEDPDAFFEANRLRPYVYRLVTGTQNADGTFKDLVASRRLITKGVAALNGPNNLGHPNYTMGAARVQAIDNFVAATLAKFNDPNDLCP
jgi:hypothetical protein